MHQSGITFSPVTEVISTCYLFIKVADIGDDTFKKKYFFSLRLDVLDIEK